MKQNKIFRYRSVDVLRGITVILMIIVNSPGNGTAYAPLQHAAWQGCTLADVVFPFFVILVGVSSVLAIAQIKNRNNGEIFRKILKRTFFIFILGLLLNAFPYHLVDYSSLRVMGVLQRIAICYFVSASLCLVSTPRIQIVILCFLLVFYSALLFIFSEASVSYIDRHLLSPAHLYTPKFDPEGLLSTLPAMASALLGNLIGFLLLSNKTDTQKMKWMFCLSILLLALGWHLAFVVPLNKSLWSSSYVLWTAGLFLFFFLCVYELIEVKKLTKWAIMFNLFGRHALLVYILHVFFLKIQAMVKIHNMAGVFVSLRVYITEVAFGFLSPKNASLAYAFSYVMLWFLVLLLFQKMKRNRFVC